MISNVVVSYTVKPDAVEEHVRLIEGIFAQLRDDARTDIEYKVMRLDDGVSFVHVSSAETADGANPLPELSAFQEFALELGSRVATPPAPSAATIIGSYRRGAPIGSQ